MTHPAADIPEILSRLPLFQQLGAEQIARLAAGSRERRLARDEMLFNKGDLPHGFFVVLLGQIKLAFPSAQGNEKVVDILGPHQSFGEAVMFMEKPYPVFAQALQDSLLLHIGDSVVSDLLATDPSFARRMLAGMSMRLHGLVQDVESYSLRSATQRVIGYLLQHCPESASAGAPVQLGLPISKHVLASRLNLTPETLSRVFHDLAGRGLIEVNGKLITIVDAQALSRCEP